MIDNKIFDILKKENIRQQNTIELIASENFTSQAVMDLCGSIFTNKYAEGRPGARWEEDEIVSVCPEGNKYLYRILRDIKTGRFE